MCWCKIEMERKRQKSDNKINLNRTLMEIYQMCIVISSAHKSLYVQQPWIIHKYTVLEWCLNFKIATSNIWPISFKLHSSWANVLYTKTIWLAISNVLTDIPAWYILMSNDSIHVDCIDRIKCVAKRKVTEKCNALKWMQIVIGHSLWRETTIQNDN